MSWTAAQQVSMRQLNHQQLGSCDGIGTIAGKAESNLLLQGSTEFLSQLLECFEPPPVDHSGMLAGKIKLYAQVCNALSVVACRSAQKVQETVGKA